MKLKLFFTVLLSLIFTSGWAQGFTVTIKATAITGESLANTKVEMEHFDYGIVYPTAFLSDKGECTLKNIMEGKNQLTITKEGLEKYTDNNIIITKDTTLNIVLKEPVRKPYALKTEYFHDARTGQSDILLSWNKETDYFFDDFESYEPFSIDFAPWTGIDGDKAPAARLSGSYPNSGLPQYATIFNPLTITPPVWYEYPVLRPYSGKQYVAFIRTEDGTTNNDWLISPKIKVGVNNVVRFLVKAGDAYKEQYKVLISTGGTKIEDFKSLTSGNYEQVGYEQWKTVQYDLSAYEGKEVHIAIQYLSKAYFMLMLDDFYVGPRNIEPSKIIRKGRSAEIPSEKFVIYCNSDSIDTTPETFFRLENLQPGSYTLGVKAKYKVSQSEVATTNASIPDASNYASVKINLTSNNGLSLDGTTVSYVNRSSGEQINDVVKSSVSELKSLEKADYLINIAPEGYEPYTQSVTVDKNIILDVQLKESIVAPYNITSDITPSGENGKMNVVLKWNQDLGFNDGFDSYPDFSQTFGDWTTVDLDKMAPYGISLSGTEVSFPGCKAASAGMVFNAKTTTPSMEQDGAITAPEGEKCYVFFSVQSGQSNDWLISPIQKIRDKYVLRFLAKSYTAMYKESFEIGISDKKETETFTILDEITASDEWTRYEVDLSKYAGQEVYIAIHYKSIDKFLMLFDSFYVGPKEESSAVTSKNASFEVYLNDAKKATVKENTYEFKGLPEGTYKVGVKAVYTSGSSETTEYTLMATSIAETNGDDIFVYSNNGNIQVVTMNENASIRVCNAAGQTLYEKKSTDKLTEIPVNQGVYILNISTDSKEIIRKVIVK